MGESEQVGEFVRWVMSREEGTGSGEGERWGEEL